MTTPTSDYVHTECTVQASWSHAQYCILKKILAIATDLSEGKEQSEIAVDTMLLLQNPIKKCDDIRGGSTQSNATTKIEWRESRTLDGQTDDEWIQAPIEET